MTTSTYVQDQKRLWLTSNIETLWGCCERSLQRAQSEDTQPHKRPAAIRTLNKAWDRYSQHINETIAWCQREGLKIGADTEMARLFQHITGPEIERHNFCNKR